MEIIVRTAKKSEISFIKSYVDNFETMDADEHTFSEKYYQRLLTKGILLVADNDHEIVGVCFGTFKVDENWADMLGLVVEPSLQKQGIGSQLVAAFEAAVKEKGISTVYLYGDKSQKKFFKNLKYTERRTYTAFQKEL